MNITKKEQKIIQRALTEWESHGDLSSEKRQQLSDSLNVSTFDWKRLSRYSFWAASICIIIALGSLFADSILMEYLGCFINYLNSFIRYVIDNVFVIRILLPTLIALGCYGWGFYRQRSQEQWHYSTEAILFFGVVFTAVAISQLGAALDNGSGHIAPLFLIGCIIYGTIGFVARSGMIWLFFLLSLGNWFGLETGYMSGGGTYWLGMGYPIRFVLFGSILLLLCFVTQSLLQQRHLFTISKVMGLLYLFVALWILSIFGNYSFNEWHMLHQTALLPWVLLFLVASIICIYISLKTDDGMLRGFGLTFLGINLYTRFFEYFWDNMHKVIFFLILGISLAVIGRYAEKIWHTQSKKESTLL